MATDLRVRQRVPSSAEPMTSPCDAGPMQTTAAAPGCQHSDSGASVGSSASRSPPASPPLQVLPSCRPSDGRRRTTDESGGDVGGPETSNGRRASVTDLPPYGNGSSSFTSRLQDKLVLCCLNGFIHVYFYLTVTFVRSIVLLNFINRMSMLSS